MIIKLLIAATILDIFKGMIVRDWKGKDMKYYKYRTLNKILVRKCVYFYKECCDYRNKAYYDKEKQQNRIRKWYKKIK